MQDREKRGSITKHSEKLKHADKADQRGKKALFVLSIAVLLLCFAAPADVLEMGNLHVQEHRSIAPDSIPRTETPGIFFADKIIQMEIQI